MYLIGIAGGSGSGKTTFARKIIQKLDDPRVALLSQDAYYLPTATNFDHPQAFDWPLLRKHLEKLRQEEPISVPIYDYASAQRTLDTQTVSGARVVLLEGIFALWDQEIRGLLDLKVFLHVESDIRFIRRLHRDVKERGRTHDQIIRMYYDVVRPMHQLYLEPTKKHADLIVGEETDVAASVLSAYVRELVQK